MENLTYKGYIAEVAVDWEADALVGRVVNVPHVITFQGRTVGEARQRFELAIDEYIIWCKKRGVEPEKPLSGRILFRTSPQHHRLLANAARGLGKSLNGWMEEVLVAAAEQLTQDITHAAAAPTKPEVHQSVPAAEAPVPPPAAHPA